MEAHMKKFYLLEELFFSSLKLDQESKNLVSEIMKNLNCLNNEGNKLILSYIPTNEDVEEIIDSLVLNSETIVEMKKNLAIIKTLKLLSLQEENALAGRIIYELGFSEKIEVTIQLEDAVESEEQIED
jgi:hypothetical protein